MKMMLSLAVAVILTGCGGNSPTYAADATGACLTANGASVDPDPSNVDYIAAAAAEGSLRATLGENEAIVSFERNAGDATDTKVAYAAFSEAFGGSSDGKLSQKGNAVISWSKSPTGEERATVEDCLG